MKRDCIYFGDKKVKSYTGEAWPSSINEDVYYFKSEKGDIIQTGGMLLSFLN